MDLAKSSTKSVRDRLDAKLKHIEEVHGIHSRPSIDDGNTQAAIGHVIKEKLLLVLDELRLSMANLKFLEECKDKHAGTCLI